MRWKVVVRAENPDASTLFTLEELTGLSRGEVLLALRRNGLAAGDDLDEDRARALADSLGGLGLSSTTLPSPGREESPSPLFKLVLTGYQPGSRARLREKLEKLSGLPPEQIVLWLSRIPFVLRDSVDHDTARTIKRALLEAGATVELKPSQSRQAMPAPAPDESPSEAPAGAAGTSGTRGGPADPAVEAADMEEPPIGDPPPGPPEIEYCTASAGPPEVLRFSAPGRSLPLPPVLPGAADLEKTPPVTVGTPSVIQASEPPVLGQALQILVSASSPIVAGRLRRTLASALDFREEEICSLKEGSMYLVATVPGPEKAEELSSMLESTGATVVVRPAGLGDVLPGTVPSDTTGFLSWLRGDG